MWERNIAAQTSQPSQLFLWSLVFGEAEDSAKETSFNFLISLSSADTYI